MKVVSLSDSQKRIVGYGVTSLGILGIALLFSVVVAAGYYVICKLQTVLVPLILGFLLSCFLKLPFECMRKMLSRGTCPSREEVVKKQLTDWWGMLVFLLFVVVFTFSIGIVTWRFGSILVDQVSSLYSNFPVLWDRLMAHFPKLHDMFVSTVDVRGFLQREVSKYVMGGMEQLLSLKNAIATCVFAIFFCYCFLLNPLRGSSIVRELKTFPILSERNWRFVERQFDRLCNMMTVYFPRQLLINFVIEGLIGGLALMLIEVPFGFVLGFLMGALNIIPIYGTIVVLPIVLLVARFSDGGSVGLMFESLAIWTLIEGADILLPVAIHGGKMKLSPGVLVFSFLFWGTVISPVWGMILAIPLSAFVIGLWRSGKQIYLNSKSGRGNDVANKGDKE